MTRDTSPCEYAVRRAGESYDGQPIPLDGHGDVTDTRSRLVQKILARVERTATCWLWRGATTGSGYGTVKLPRTRRTAYVHRVLYEEIVGPVPEGLILGHLCHTRACVRPDHLRPMSVRESLLRSEATLAGAAERQTACQRGHPFDAENTRIGPRARRTCRRCVALNAQRRKQARQPFAPSTIATLGGPTMPENGTAKTTQGPPVQFRDRAVERELDARATSRLSRNLVASRDLERYYEALQRELAEIPLTRGEALALMDATNGTLFEPWSAPLLWTNLADAEEDLGAKWGIDRAALVAKLKALSYTPALALCDAAERFWALGEIADEDAALARLGLRLVG